MVKLWSWAPTKIWTYLQNYALHITDILNVNILSLMITNFLSKKHKVADLKSTKFAVKTKYN
jgi:hypothetical protein